MSRLIKEKKGQFVIITALLIAALTLATTISIYEINSNSQEITYRPGNEFLLGTTSDLNRALTVALANYTEGIRIQNLSEAEANFNPSQFMTTWKESMLTAYSSYGIRINPDCNMIPRFEIGPWYNNTPWSGNTTFSYAYMPYSLDVNSYGINGWVGETRKYVQLKIFSETVKTTDLTGPTSLIFQLTQSEVNENYSMPIPDLPTVPDPETFRIGAYNAISQSFTPVEEILPLTYLGGGNYSVTFNQAIDPIHKGVRLDLSTPKDEIWISAFNYNYSSASPIISTMLLNPTGTLPSPETLTLGESVTESVTVAGLEGYPVPSGTVAFQVSVDGGSNWITFDDKALDGSGSVTSDPYNATSTGTYYFQAIYSGDDNYASATYSQAPEILTINKTTPTEGPESPGLTVSSDDSQSFDCSVTVVGLGVGYPVPSGTVVFQVNGSSWAIGSKALDGSGSVTSDPYPYDENAPGTYYFQAIYSGDDNYASATYSQTVEILTINRVTPEVITSLSSRIVTLGESVTESVTVAGLEGYPVPSGTVAFQVSSDGGSSWATIGSKALDGSGSAASDLYTPFSAGAWEFKVIYLGDNYYQSVESFPTDPLTVNKVTPTLANSLFPATIIIGQNTAESATVFGVVGGLTPTGNVSFQVSIDGVSNWTTFGANKTLQGGFATSDLYKPFSAGPWYFRANYSGDRNYVSASSGIVTLIVSMVPGQVGTYYVVSDSPSGQNPYLSNSTNLPPLDKVNPDLSNGHQSLNVTTKLTSPVPSILMSNTISITYALQVKSTQTIQTEIGFIYNNTYYRIGCANFEATGACGNPPPTYYTVSIPVNGKTFVTGFPAQTIPAGSKIVLRTTLLDPKERVNLMGGMGGTRIVFY
jgi:hypothetical protein